MARLGRRRERLVSEQFLELVDDDEQVLSGIEVGLLERIDQTKLPMRSVDSISSARRETRLVHLVRRQHAGARKGLGQGRIGRLPGRSDVTRQALPA